MTVHAQFEGDRADPIVIRSIFRDRTGPVGRELNEKSLLVLNRARSLVGVRTTTLISSIRREPGTSARGPYVDVTAGVPGLTTYLGYHMDGTGPHIILPTRRKSLRFLSGGRVVFAKKVFHPGTKPNPFLVRALDVLR